MYWHNRWLAGPDVYALYSPRIPGPDSPERKVVPGSFRGYSVGLLVNYVYIIIYCVHKFQIN